MADYATPAAPPPSGDAVIAERMAGPAATQSSDAVTFYSAWFCPFAQRVWIALEAKHVKYQWVECELYEGERSGSSKVALSLEEKRRRTPGFIECCPRGLVPGIEYQGHRLYDSLALTEFVDESFDGPPLMPPTPAGRARVKIWTAFCAEKVIPFYYRLLMTQTHHERESARETLLNGLKTLSTDAFTSVSGPFLMGDSFSLFECHFLPWWQRMHVVLAAYRGFTLPSAHESPAFAALHKWGAACESFKPFTRTVVDRERLIANNIGYADNRATSTCAQIMRGTDATSSHKATNDLPAYQTTGGAVSATGTSTNDTTSVPTSLSQVLPTAPSAPTPSVAHTSASACAAKPEATTPPSLTAVPHMTNPEDPHASKGVLGVLYGRLSSNNSARIRLFLYLRGIEHLYELKQLSHTELSTFAPFLACSPHGKVPALALANGLAFTEAAVILRYLADAHPAQPTQPQLLPTKPDERARMQQIIQIHDVYIASPNSSQPGMNSHNMGCMFLPPTGGRVASARALDPSVRAAKLAEVWRQLDVLESLFPPKVASQAQLTLADLSLYPTFVYLTFYFPIVFAPTDPFHGRPKLRSWFCAVDAIAEFRRVRDEMQPVLDAKLASGDLEEIVAQIRQAPHLKWLYP